MFSVYNSLHYDLSLGILSCGTLRWSLRLHCVLLRCMALHCVTLLCMWLHSVVFRFSSFIWLHIPCCRILRSVALKVFCVRLLTQYPLYLSVINLRCHCWHCLIRPGRRLDFRQSYRVDGSSIENTHFHQSFMYLAKFRRFWIGQFLGTLLLCANQMQFALLQRLSLVGDRWSSTACRMTAVVQCQVSCLCRVCNALAPFSLPFQPLLALSLPSVAIFLVMCKGEVFSRCGVIQNCCWASNIVEAGVLQ